FLYRARPPLSTLFPYTTLFRSSPLLSILLWCHVISRAQMTLERFEFFSVLKADEMLRGDRLLDRNRRFRCLARRLALTPQDPGQGGMHFTDQRRERGSRNRVVADV